MVTLLAPKLRRKIRNLVNSSNRKREREREVQDSLRRAEHSELLGSNWERLEKDEAQGLLVSLLKTKMEDLQVIASILDAHPVEREIILKGTTREKLDKSVSGVRTELSLIGSALKGDVCEPKASFFIGCSNIGLWDFL